MRLPVHLAGGSATPTARRAGGNLLVISGDLSHRKKLTTALQRCLLELAREQLGGMLQRESERCGLVYRKLSIRRQRTRWGSCSARGTISLNVAIAFQSPEIARYLIIHELAHTLHMNHSLEFWACVERYCPAWRSLDRQLASGWQRVPRWVFE